MNEKAYKTIIMRSKLKNYICKSLLLWRLRCSLKLFKDDKLMNIKIKNCFIWIGEKLNELQGGTTSEDIPDCLIKILSSTSSL